MSKVCLGIASSDYIRTQTAGMMFSLAKSYPDMRLIIKQSPYVHDNREQIATDFLETDCTHLFFVDSDMLFKPDVLETLLANDLDIVGAQYNKRIGREGVPVVNTRFDQQNIPYPEEPFKNWGVATGCLLIKREVFEKIPQPWFALGTEDHWLGEDVYFCRKAKANGVGVWIDPRPEVKHIGEHLY